MSDNVHGALQWMSDVGVPEEEVEWIKRIAAAPHGHPVNRTRLEAVHDMAYRGLVATIKLPANQVQAN